MLYCNLVSSFLLGLWVVYMLGYTSVRAPLCTPLEHFWTFPEWAIVLWSVLIIGSMYARQIQHHICPHHVCPLFIIILCLATVK